jgi:membrane protein DedA with SNARE-associated domain
MHFIDQIISGLSAVILWMINHFGYAGIVLAMTIESACIPLPSEIIMTFAGFLVSEGVFNLTGVTLAGAAGNLFGSWLAYLAGRYGGRSFLERYGRYFLASPKELAKADQWFSRYGEMTVFLTRLLPVIRTFISLPAGISKMKFFRFSFYSFAGSVPWCLGLALVGKLLGSRWREIGPVFHQFDFIVIIALIAALFWIRRSQVAKKVSE